MESGIKEIWKNDKTTVIECQGRIYIETFNDDEERFVYKTYLTRKWVENSFKWLDGNPTENLLDKVYNDMTMDWGLNSEESEEILNFLFNEHFKNEIEKMENNYYTELVLD